MRSSNIAGQYGLWLLVAVLNLTIAGCGASTADSSNAGGTSGKEKVGHFPMRSEGPKTLDPVRGSTQYDNLCCGQIIDTLVQYKYLKRPFELEPLLLTEMPTTEDDLTWKFTLRDDVYFHDSTCFPGGDTPPVRRPAGCRPAPFS